MPETNFLHLIFLYIKIKKRDLGVRVFITSFVILLYERGDRMLDWFILFIELISLLIQVLEYKKSYRTELTVVYIFIL